MWKGVSLDHLRKIQGRDISMVFQDKKVVGKIRLKSETFLELDGFSFYCSVGGDCIVETSNIYPEDVEPSVKRLGKSRILINSDGEYTLRTNFIGWMHHYGDCDASRFMKQQELALEYS